MKAVIRRLGVVVSNLNVKLGFAILALSIFTGGVSFATSMRDGAGQASPRDGDVGSCVLKDMNNVIYASESATTMADCESAIWTSVVGTAEKNFSVCTQSAPDETSIGAFIYALGYDLGPKQKLSTGNYVELSVTFTIDRVSATVYYFVGSGSSTGYENLSACFVSGPLTNSSQLETSYLQWFQSPQGN